MRQKHRGCASARNLLALFVLAGFLVIWLQISNHGLVQISPGGSQTDNGHDQPTPSAKQSTAIAKAKTWSLPPSIQLETWTIASSGSFSKVVPQQFHAAQRDIHVCFTPEGSDEQLGRMIQSMRSILVSAEITTRKRLVFHILGKGLPELDKHLGVLIRSGEAQAELPKGIKVYRGATDLVPKNRKVHSTLKKLEKDEVYVRFFIPSILDESVDKFLYLDTDTAVVADLAGAYDQVLKGKYTLAAGVQNRSICTLGKMLDLTDERLKPLGIKPNDLCLSGGAFFVDRWRWLKENRTQRWKHWIEENAKKKLYYLGCMPPQMIDFHNQWEQLPSTLLRDFKGHKCCPPKYSASLLLNGQSLILHPLKNVKEAGDFKRFFELSSA